MTRKGLKKLKTVEREAVELQVDATVVMATLQSIHCEEEVGLDQEAKKRLLSATRLAREAVNCMMSCVSETRRAYEIEKGLMYLGDELFNRQDNDKARTK